MSLVSQRPDGTFIKEPSPLEKDLYRQAYSTEDKDLIADIKEDIKKIFLILTTYGFSIDNLIDFSNLLEVDAVKLNGHAAEDYALKTEIPSIIFKIPSSMPVDDGEYIGELSNEYVSVPTSVGSLLYLTTNGYALAKADNNAKLPCVAMAIATSVTGNNLILKKGYIKNSIWNLTKGSILYVHPTISGGITTTIPSTNEYVQIIGYVVDTNIIYFNPQYTITKL